LSAAAERAITQRAAKDGKGVEDVARELIEQGVAAEKTFDEVLAPFRQSFAGSGMTEEEVDVLVEEARTEIWEERQRKPS